MSEAARRPGRLGRAGRRLLEASAFAFAVATCSCRTGLEAPSIEEPFPIVIVMIDALRTDRVIRDDGFTPLVPNLAALARDGVTFRNAFSSGPKTIPSVPQLFTSRYFPDLHHETTLLTVCRDAGYEATAAFIHNPYVSKWLGRLDPTFERLAGGEFDAKRLTDDAIAWLATAPANPFALYVHYLDVHTPLRPPAEVARRFVDPSYRGSIGLEFQGVTGAAAAAFDDADRRRVAQLYDASVFATDAHLGRLLEALRARGVYDDALIVVTSDHGEELWDHGSFFHGHTLYDELLRVPLVVKFPRGWAAGRTVDELARTVDVLPTIADLLPAEATGGAAALDGRSLVPLVTGREAGRTLFATVARVDDRSPPLHAVRTASAKLVHDVRTGEELLFDLARDPHERENLASEPSAAAMLADLRAQLADYLQDVKDTGVHARISNGTKQAVRYRIEATLIAPFVNFARFDMEPGDTIRQRPKADGLIASGTLEPGDSDHFRFDVLATRAALSVGVEIDDRKGPVDVCRGDEPRCETVDNGSARVVLEQVETTAAPTARATSAVQVEWWSVPGASEPIAPALSPSDRERLRALGYAE